MPELTGLGGLKLDAGMLAKSLDSTVLAERMGLATIATAAGVTESTLIAKYAGTLSAAVFTPGASLVASDTNWIQFAVKNKGTGGANVDMLDTGAGNSTKVTGGTALTAYTKRPLTLNATPANLAVAAGDTISITATTTGTLPNTVTAPSLLLTITPS